MKTNEQLNSENGYKRGVYVFDITTHTVGIIRAVNMHAYPPICRVFYGEGTTEWTSARDLDIISPDDARIPRAFGSSASVLHVDATGKTREQIDDYIEYARADKRSTYVSHLENMRKTKHRHAVGTRGDYYPYAGPHVASPCIVISHDTCYTWSGYIDPYYTIQYLNDTTRMWVRGSQVMPYPNQ